MNEPLLQQLAEYSGLAFERSYLRYEELLFAELLVKACAERCVNRYDAKNILELFGIDT